MFFNDLAGIVRTVVVAVFAYMGLVLFLRISGKRTLSKMNAFDLVVTVALGSCLATALLSKQTALLEGLTAFAMLILLQYVVTWTAYRVPWFGKLIKSEPSLLLYNGAFLEPAMKRERIVREELLAALRKNGVASLEEVHAVVLETDGSLHVITGAPGRGVNSTLATMRHPRG